MSKVNMALVNKIKNTKKEVVKTFSIDGEELAVVVQKNFTQEMQEPTVASVLKYTQMFKEVIEDKEENFELLLFNIVLLDVLTDIELPETIEEIIDLINGLMDLGIVQELLEELSKSKVVSNIAEYIKHIGQAVENYGKGDKSEE